MLITKKNLFLSISIFLLTALSQPLAFSNDDASADSDELIEAHTPSPTTRPTEANVGKNGSVKRKQGPARAHQPSQEQLEIDTD